MTFALTSRKRVGAICLTVLAVSLFAFSPLASMAQAEPAAPSVDQQNPPAAPQTPPTAPQPNAGGESATGGGALLERPTDGAEIYGEIGYAMLSLFALFTGVAGVTLNAAVYYTVITMADFVNGLGSILTAWKVIRDVGNIALIFGFIAIGIATILDVQSYNAKKMLVKLIIVAVTVNFSLFVARAIIDVGNVFAFQFYTQMVQTGVAKDIGSADVTVTDEGVSNAIMQMVGLQTFYDASTRNDPAQIETLKQNSFFAFIFGSLLFIIAAFVLFALAFILIARFVILVFLMILSPMGFIGLIVPTLEKRAQDWWRTLIAQAAVAPILLLMLLVSVTLITKSQIFGLSGGRQGGFDAIFNPESSANDWLLTANMILGFLISMGFLMASVIVAKQMGAFGASFAIGASRRIVGVALSPISVPARAGGSWAARGALNKAGNIYGSGDNRLGRTLRNLGPLGTLTDEALAGISGKVKAVKVDGKNYAERRKEVEHREHETGQFEIFRQLREAGNPDDRSRILQGMSLADTIAYLEKANAQQRQEAGDAMNSERYSDLMKNDKVSDAIKHDLTHGRYADARSILGSDPANPPTLNPQQLADLKRITRDFTARDLELMPPELLTNPELVKQLSESQAEEITKNANRNVAAVVKRQIKTIREGRFADRVSADAAFKTMTGEQIAGLDGDILRQTHVLDALETNMDAYDAVVRSKKLNTADRALVVQRGVAILNNPNHPLAPQFAARAAGDVTFALALGLQPQPLKVTVVSGNTGGNQAATNQPVTRPARTPGSLAGNLPNTRPARNP